MILRGMELESATVITPEKAGFRMGLAKQKIACETASWNIFDGNHLLIPIHSKM